MPSWITHLVTAKKIKHQEEENEFIFANIMPDILEGYNVQEVSKIVRDYQTHYPKKQEINGITIPVPDIQKFKEQYREKLQNPIIKGYYCHLLTDYYWNTYTYENYFESYKKEQDLVKIRLNKGEEKILKWDEAVRIKQRDFKNFTNYLKDKEKITIPYYDPKIREYSKDLIEFEYTEADIKNTIFSIQKMLKSQEKEEKEYQLFTKEELVKKLEESVLFIEERLI